MGALDGVEAVVGLALLFVLPGFALSIREWFAEAERTGTEMVLACGE